MEDRDVFRKKIFLKTFILKNFIFYYISWPVLPHSHLHPYYFEANLRYHTVSSIGILVCVTKDSLLF